MEAHMKLEMQYERDSNVKPYIHSLPSKPSDGYNAIAKNQLQSLKETQKCPFPLIRQLILMYTYQPSDHLDLPPGDIFKEKILANLPLAQLERELHRVTEYWMSQFRRVTIFEECILKYQAYRNELIGREKMIASQKEVDLPTQMREGLKNIENEKQKILMQGSHYEEAQFKIEVQKSSNQKKLLLFQHLKPQYDQKAKEFQHKQNQLLHFTIFATELEKALIFILKEKSVDFQNNKDIGEVLEIFLLLVLENKQEITIFVQKSMKHFFDWKNKVKHSQESGNELVDKQIENSSLELEGNMDLHVYSHINNLIAVIRKDLEEIQNVSQVVWKKYKEFMEVYVDVNEVDRFFQKESVVDDIIQMERSHLANHLKNNYGMIVPYVKSDDYIKFIDFFQKNPKSYLSFEIEKKVSFIEKAIIYINRDYNSWHREACEDRAGVKQKIAEKISQWKDEPEQNKEIATLLLESCRKLMTIAKY